MKRWPYIETAKDCWRLGSGFTVETALAALYDPVLKEPVPQDMLDRLAELK